MIRQFLRVQRPTRVGRPSQRGRVSGAQPGSTGGGAGGGAYSRPSGATTSPVNVGQSVTVKIGYVSFTGNHGLEAGPDNTNSALGAWRGTEGVAVSARCDRVLVSLRVPFSTRTSEYWVRRSQFWRIFEAA